MNQGTVDAVSKERLDAPIEPKNGCAERSDYVVESTPWL